MKKVIMQDVVTGEEIAPVTHVNNIEGLDNTPISEQYIGDVEEVTGVTREELEKDLFIKLWNEACGIYGKYNKETGFFELNGLTDITFEQAILIYRLTSYPIIQGNTELKAICLVNAAIRTNLPMAISISNPLNLNCAFMGCIKMEVVNNPDYYGNGALYKTMQQAFKWCRKLRKFMNIIKVSACNDISGAFDFCDSLEEIRLTALDKNVGFKDSPNLTLFSLNYMVEHSANTNPITITIHPDIYAKLSTEEEWMALNELAISKNISFATV